MQLIEGDYWEHIDQADLLCFTANSTISKGGKLIMGAGIAEQFKERFPELPEKFGKLIKDKGYTYYKPYGLLCTTHSGYKIGAFQVKRFWKDLADPDLIRHATTILHRLALLHPDKRLHLNMPGTGFGGLKEEVVLPIIQKLPDNVYIYRR